MGSVIVFFHSYIMFVLFLWQKKIILLYFTLLYSDAGAMDHIGSDSEYKRAHCGVKTYKCDHCGKCFSRKSAIVIHIRTHTGEKPYKCDQCTMSFSQTGHLIRHKRTHTGEKPHKCDQCGKCFVLKHHLNTHKSTHTGEKPYKCDQCGKFFSHTSSLILHKRMHTGEKPCKCDQCGKCFAYPSQFSRHRRVHIDKHLEAIPGGTGTSEEQDKCGNWSLIKNDPIHVSELLSVVDIKTNDEDIVIKEEPLDEFITEDEDIVIKEEPLM